MIAKTVTGSDFEGALSYGAGQRQGKRKEPAEAPLLVVANVIPGTPKQMAQEMQAAAQQSQRIKKPVWHTVLSWPQEEVVSQQQKVQAVQRYCELMGAPIERHQVVVYEHRDKAHAHVHIYLNRVPIDGGPALRTDNNFYKQPKICRQISQELGMAPLPTRRQSLKDIDPSKQAAREHIRQALSQALGQSGVKDVVWLQAQLAHEGVGVRYTHDKGGILRGISFERAGITLKGQAVGYKAAQVREQLSQTGLRPQAAPTQTPEQTPTTEKRRTRRQSPSQ